jgi:hypothetical protein
MKLAVLHNALDNSVAGKSSGQEKFIPFASVKFAIEKFHQSVSKRVLYETKPLFHKGAFGGQLLL